MAIVIGIDEAGLGPNYGPFVVTATVWEVPDDNLRIDFWLALAHVVTSDPKSCDGRLVITDSKLLFQPHRGLHQLETTVWEMLQAVGVRVNTLRDLVTVLQKNAPCWEHEPWLASENPPLPVESNGVDSTTELPEQFTPLSSGPLRLLQIASRVVEASEFNRLLDSGNKSDLVTRCHFGLLKRLCDEFPASDILVYSDKHGGRNRYAAALQQSWEGAWVATEHESATHSVYRLERIEFQFQPRAESLLPVAAASLVCKYLREVSMGAFNRFWQSQRPDLVPTQGYPQDARRFAADIEPSRARLNIPLEHLWRRK